MASRVGYTEGRVFYWAETKMTDIEKAQFAVEMINCLLGIDQKIKAIMLTQKLFQTNLRDTKKLVDFIEALLNERI